MGDRVVAGRGRSGRSRGRVWGWSLAGGSALALLGTTQEYTSRWIEGLPADLTTLFLREAVYWLTWALLAPFALVLSGLVSALQVGRTRAAAAWIAGALAFLAAHSTIEVVSARALGLVPTPMPLATNIVARFTATLAPNLAVFGFVVLAFNAAERHEEARARELREADLQTQLALAQLTVLRMQLQPHFLFNTLHAVSSLMDTNVVAARRMLVRLGELLRSALAHGDQDEVRLEDELAFLEKYLEIQRIRFEDRLTVSVQADDDVLSARVPPLLLQPLVENALRHGVERRAGPGFVRIRAYRRGDELRLEVADNGPGLADTPGTQSGLGQGVGLSNTRARLEQHYGAAQRLELTSAEEGGLAVRVTMPFAELPAPARGGGEHSS